MAEIGEEFPLIRLALGVFKLAMRQYGVPEHLDGECPAEPCPCGDTEAIALRALALLADPYIDYAKFCADCVALVPLAASRYPLSNGFVLCEPCGEERDMPESSRTGWHHEPVPWETDRAWYHGGIGGLEVGDLILPPAATGATGTGDDPLGLVFITTRLERAHAFACASSGDLYQVIPVDLQTGVGRVAPTLGPVGDHACRYATIARVIERGLQPQTVIIRDLTRGTVSTSHIGLGPGDRRPGWAPAPSLLRRQEPE